MMPPRRAAADWPRLLCPAPGCQPPAQPLGRPERVLHIADRRPDDTDNEVGRAFRRLAARPADYRQVNLADPSIIADAEALDLAAELRPTLIFLHPQRESLFTPEVIGELRALAAPE
jgi:hypothetical protein